MPAIESTNSRSEAQKERVSTACTYCRYRKVKCDGQQPSCGFCVHMGKTDCTYAKVSEEENRHLRLRKRELRARRAAQRHASGPADMDGVATTGEIMPNSPEAMSSTVSPSASAASMTSIKRRRSSNVTANLPRRQRKRAASDMAPPPSLPMGSPALSATSAATASNASMPMMPTETLSSNLLSLWQTTASMPHFLSPSDYAQAVAPPSLRRASEMSLPYAGAEWQHGQTHNPASNAFAHLADSSSSWSYRDLQLGQGMASTSSDPMHRHRVGGIPAWTATSIDDSTPAAIPVSHPNISYGFLPYSEEAQSGSTTSSGAGVDFPSALPVTMSTSSSTAIERHTPSKAASNGHHHLAWTASQPWTQSYQLATDATMCSETPSQIGLGVTTTSTAMDQAGESSTSSCHTTRHATPSKAKRPSSTSNTAASTMGFGPMQSLPSDPTDGLAGIFDLWPTATNVHMADTASDEGEGSTMATSLTDDTLFDVSPPTALADKVDFPPQLRRLMQSSGNPFVAHPVTPLAMSLSSDLRRTLDRITRGTTCNEEETPERDAARRCVPPPV